jgi:hypothetical protein
MSSRDAHERPLAELKAPGSTVRRFRRRWGTVTASLARGYGEFPAKSSSPGHASGLTSRRQ